MLHGDSDAGSQPADITPSTRESAPQSEMHSLLASTTTIRSQVLLATAWVSLREPSGRSVAVRALIDQGSEVTLISENVAQLLRVKRILMSIAVSAVGGIHAGVCKHGAQILISPLNSFRPTYSTTALIIKKLTSYAPKRVADLAALSHLKDLQWADTAPTGSNPI